MLVYLYLACSAVAFAGGEYFGKLWAESPRPSLMVFAALCYVSSSLLWLPALRITKTLIVTGMVWSVFATLATVLLGALVFGETLSPLQWFGVSIAALAVLLLSA